MHSMLRFLPDVLLKSRPIHLTVFLTDRCNARCPFCFYVDTKRDGAAMVKEITLQEAAKLADGLGPLLWLAFSGGEIFLREDLLELSSVFYERNRPSIMLYPTNGLMPGRIYEQTEKILMNCPKSTVVVKLSIDGIRGKHDQLRGVEGAFRKVIDSYVNLGGLTKRYKNFELGINTVFCSENQDDMDEIIDYVRGLKKVKTHTISMVRGDIRDKSYKEVDTGKYLAAVRRLESGLVEGKSPMYSFKGARLKAAQDILQRNVIYRTLTQNKRQLPCYAGRLNLVVTESADLYPCEDFSEKLKIGNLRDVGFDLKGLLSSPRAREVIAAIKDGCFCSHECYLMTNILFNPRTYPELISNYLKMNKSA